LSFETEKILTDNPLSLFERALAQVEAFSDKNVAVMPEKPGAEMLNYIAHVTGEDTDKLKRLYELFLATGRLDAFGKHEPVSAGFAEDYHD
jgi:hypothetical protein